MSPTERELRAALRDGDGEPLDPDQVIGRARAARRQRRVRGLSVTAAVAVVAAVGAVGGLALRPDAKDDNAYSPASGYATHTPGVNPGGPIDESVCPATYPKGIVVATPSRPAGKVSAQLIVDGSVTAIVVCGYSADTPRASITLTGAQAATLAASLNAASRTRSSGACPTYQVADATPIVMIASTASGRLPAVVTQLGQNPCNLVTVNELGVMRYGWTPPASLSSQFARLRAQTPSGRTSTTPGLSGGGGVSTPGSGGASTVTDPPITVNQPTPPRASGSPAR